MQLEFDTDEALELLDELILKGRLDQKEQEALRFTAVLQITAHAASRPQLTAKDHQLLALLLGRWGFAVTDREEIAVDELTDAYPITLVSLARVLRRELEAIEQSLGRLAAARLIGLEPADEGGKRDAYAVNFLPVLTALAPSLTGVLWREFVDREGYELRCTAQHHTEAIKTEIEELREFRPACPRLRILRDDYREFQVRTSLPDLMARWHDEPAAVYAWLKELADFEDRFAVLSGTPSTGLQSELANRASKRILILGRHLEPPPVTANAA